MTTTNSHANQAERDRLADRIKQARELLAEIPDDETADYPAYFGRLEVALSLLADAAELAIQGPLPEPEYDPELDPDFDG